VCARARARVYVCVCACTKRKDVNLTLIMFSGLSDTCKNVKINIFIFILTFLHVLKSSLNVFKLKLIFYFYNVCIHIYTYIKKS